MTREDDLETLATTNGWTFSIEDHDDLIQLPFRFFTDGVAHVVMDVIEGERGGRDFVAFDYEWRILALGAAETEMTMDASCVVLALPVDCPEVMVSHETASHWLTHPGHHTVFASEDHNFARAFRVTTTHPDFAARVFDGAVEDWFLRGLPDHDLCFEIAGPWLMAFTHRRDPDQVLMVVDAAIALAEHIPPSAFEDAPEPAG
jgi:hypothetical protein